MSTDSRNVEQGRGRMLLAGEDASALQPVGIRPALATYLNDLWGRRHFIWMDSRHRVATSNSRNRLGSVWLILRPILDAAFYYVIFGLVLKMSGGVENFAAFIIIGIMMFRSTARSLSGGAGALSSSRAMIRAFIFPRAAIPISVEIRDGIQMIPTFLVMALMILILPPFVEPAWSWFLAAPIFALQWMMNLGITLILSRAGNVIPDLSQVMAFVSRIAMYGSGVIFPINRFVSHPVALSVIELNPIYQALAMYREVLMDGTIPALESWIILGGWGAGLLLFGFLFFWRGEASYGGGD